MCACVLILCNLRCSATQQFSLSWALAGPYRVVRIAWKRGTERAALIQFLHLITPLLQNAHRNPCLQNCTQNKNKKKTRKWKRQSAANPPQERRAWLSNCSYSSHTRHISISACLCRHYMQVKHNQDIITLFIIQSRCVRALALASFSCRRRLAARFA